MSFIVLSSSCLEAMGVREPAPAVRGFAFVSAEEAQTRPPFAQPAHLLPLEASGPWLTADLQGLPFIPYFQCTGFTFQLIWSFKEPTSTFLLLFWSVFCPLWFEVKRSVGSPEDQSEKFGMPALQPVVNTVTRSVRAGDSTQVSGRVRYRPYTKLNRVTSGRFSLSTEVEGVNEATCQTAQDQALSPLTSLLMQ